MKRRGFLQLLGLGPTAVLLPSQLQAAPIPIKPERLVTPAPVTTYDLTDDSVVVCCMLSITSARGYGGSATMLQQGPK